MAVWVRPKDAGRKKGKFAFLVDWNAMGEEFEKLAVMSLSEGPEDLILTRSGDSLGSC
jgi:hypothetical protein